MTHNTPEFTDNTFGEPKSSQGEKGLYLACAEVYKKLSTLKKNLISRDVSSINLKIMGSLDMITFSSALLSLLAGSEAL